MTSRVLSLWFPTLATDRIKRSRQEPVKVEAPIATFIRQKGKLTLKALCPLGKRLKLTAGLSLADARALVPKLAAYPDEPEAEAKLLGEIVLWCERYTPWAAVDGSAIGRAGGALWLDLSGSAHLFGGEAGLVEDLLARLRRQGLTAKAAVADHPGTAWAIARYGRTEGRIVPRRGAKVALARLSIAALRLETDQVAMLESFGLHHIEDLYALPRQTLSTRFGEMLVTRLDQALGLIDEPISPHAPLPAHRTQLIFADPIIRQDMMSSMADQLLHQLCVGLEAAGLGARRLILACYRVDNSTASLTIDTARPQHHAKALARLFHDKLQGLDLGLGIERAILEAIEIEPILSQAIAWRGFADYGAEEESAQLQDIQLRDIAPVADHLLPVMDDEAVAHIGLQRPSSSKTARQQRSACGALATAMELVHDPAPCHLPCSKVPFPPLHLFRQPEPIEAIAPLPDEPPMLFRWRQKVHKIVKAQGPEQIAPAWWREPQSTHPRRGQEPLARAYFVVEDMDGARFWLFREGLYSDAPKRLPRWYLHGLFV